MQEHPLRYDRQSANGDTAPGHGALERIQTLERDRQRVACELRDETAQVLGFALLHLAAVRERPDLALELAELDLLRGALRTELSRVLAIVSGLAGPVI